MFSTRPPQCTDFVNIPSLLMYVVSDFSISKFNIVCDQLGVPLETVSLQKEYWRDVVQYTLQEAKRGHTPNPDIMCNSRVKFGRFYDYVGR